MYTLFFHFPTFLNTHANTHKKVGDGAGVGVWGLCRLIKYEYLLSSPPVNYRHDGNIEFRG